MTIPALTKIIPEDMQEDRSLCPVRALKYYLKKTKDIRGFRRKLFTAHKKGHTQEIHPNTISAWIKDVIVMAYKEGDDDQFFRVTGIKAHQIRSMAASTAFHKNVSLEGVMRACSWKSHNTFTQYYLKDVALLDGEMHRLGPIVAAQHVV